MFFPLVIPVVFLLGFIIFMGRGLILEPRERDLDEMIPYVTSLDDSIEAFEKLLDFSPQGSKNLQIGRLQGKFLCGQRLRHILEFLDGFDHNAKLFRGLARYEISLLGKPEMYDDYGRTACRLLNGTSLCRLFVFLAKTQVRLFVIANEMTWFVVSPRLSPVLGYCCGRLLEEYGEIRGLALSLASSQGEHYYDNLLSAL